MKTIGVIIFALFILFVGISQMIVTVPSDDTNITRNDIEVNTIEEKPYSNMCQFEKMTLEKLQKMISEEGLDIKVTQSDVDEINKMPLCIDLCEEQLEYSKEYDDWYADNDVRDICEEVGITLPPNR